MFEAFTHAVGCCGVAAIYVVATLVAIAVIDFVVFEIKNHKR